MDEPKNRKSILEVLQSKSAGHQEKIKYDSTNLSDEELGDKLDKFINIDRKLTPDDYNEMSVLVNEILARGRANEVFSILNV